MRVSTMVEKILNGVRLPKAGEVMPLNLKDPEVEALVDDFSKTDLEQT